MRSVWFSTCNFESSTSNELIILQVDKHCQETLQVLTHRQETLLK